MTDADLDKARAKGARQSPVRVHVRAPVRTFLRHSLVLSHSLHDSSMQDLAPWEVVKAEGNQLFAAKRFAPAADRYTEAIVGGCCGEPARADTSFSDS